MPLTPDSRLRIVRFRPYRRGMGPTFALTTWDTYRTDEYGKSILGYRLTMTDGGRRSVLFQAEDFHCPPMRSIDSDASIESLMTFLTLKPGDTDPEYFEGYTDAQRAYCDAFADTLQSEVQARCCDENGNPKDRS